MDNTTKQHLLQRAAGLLGRGEIARLLNTPPPVLEAWLCGKADMPDGKLLVLAALLEEQAKSN